MLPNANRFHDRPDRLNIFWDDWDDPDDHMETRLYRNSFLKYNLTFQRIGHPCSFSWAHAHQTPPVHLTLRFFIVIDAECNIFLFSFHWHIE